MRANLHAPTFFFFRGFVGGFFFSETRRDFLHVYKISVSAFTLGSKKERERRRTTLRKSLLAAERGGGSGGWGDKSLLFFALPSSPATAAFFFFFHTKASFTHELRTAAKNQRGVVALNEAFPTGGHRWGAATLLGNSTRNLWNMEGEKKKTDFPSVYHCTTAASKRDRNQQTCCRTSIYPGSNAVPAFRRTFNVAADQSCVHEDDSTSRDMFSIHLHAYTHVPNSGNLDLILSKCLRILRGLNVRSFNFTSWLNLTKQCWAVILLKERAG